MLKWAQRFLKDSFYVCEYSSEQGESGKFACLGETRDEAREDAIERVKRVAYFNGEFTVSVRAATLLERLR